MIVVFSKSSDKIKEGDLIALTKNDEFIGYGEAKIVLQNKVLVEVEAKLHKVFNSLYDESIPFDTQICD